MVGKRLMPYGRSFGKSRSVIRGNDGFLNIYIQNSLMNCLSFSKE